VSKRVKGKMQLGAKNLKGWDAAIADVKRRIRELTFSLMVFRRHKKAGDPWPTATRN
jgi:hypothetical protein